MLTESEKKWLKNRNRWGDLYCSRCDGRFHCYEYMLMEGCPKDPDLADALEFSERVAAKLADPYWPPFLHLHISSYEYRLLPAEERLKIARLQVEEEMENG